MQPLSGEDRVTVRAFWRWLVRDRQWPAAALFAACFLFAILPLLAALAEGALAVHVQLTEGLTSVWSPLP